MSLFDELDDAELVIADEDFGLLYVWYGQSAFQVLNQDGDVVDAFSTTTPKHRALMVGEARAVIEAHRQEMRGDEP